MQWVMGWRDATGNGMEGSIAKDSKQQEERLSENGHSSGRVKCGGSKVEGRVQWVEVQRTSMYTWPETFETCIHDGALDII